MPFMPWRRMDLALGGVVLETRPIAIGAATGCILWAFVRVERFLGRRFLDFCACFGCFGPGLVSIPTSGSRGAGWDGECWKRGVEIGDGRNCFCFCGILICFVLDDDGGLV